MLIIFIILSLIAASLISVFVIQLDIIWKILIGILLVFGFYALFWGLYIIFLVLISIPVKRNKELPKPNKFYKYMLSLSCRMVFKQFHMRFHIKHNVELPEDERFILISNHISNFDPMAIEAFYYKYKIVHISKIELLNAPVVGNVLYKCGYLGLDRQNLRAEVKTIHQAIEILSNDVASICVLPEGTRNKTSNELLPFKAGCFKIALKSKKPIIVASITGTRDVKKNLFFKRHHIYLNFLAKIDYEQYKDMTTTEIAQMTQEIIANDIKGRY